MFPRNTALPRCNPLMGSSHTIGRMWGDFKYFREAPDPSGGWRNLRPPPFPSCFPNKGDDWWEEESLNLKTVTSATIEFAPENQDGYRILGLHYRTGLAGRVVAGDFKW